MNFFKKSLIVGAMALLASNSFAASGNHNVTIGPVKAMSQNLPKATDIYKATDAELELVKQYSLITYRNIVDGLGFSEAEVRQFAQTILDSLDKKTQADVSPEDYQKLIAYLNERGQKIQKVMLEAQAQQNITAGKKEFDTFVNSGAHVDADQPGVAYKIIKEGTGRQIKDTDVIKVTYKGSFIDGRIFDQSTDAKNPIEPPGIALLPCKP